MADLLVVGGESIIEELEAYRDMKDVKKRGSLFKGLDEFFVEIDTTDPEGGSIKYFNHNISCRVPFLILHETDSGFYATVAMFTMLVSNNNKRKSSSSSTPHPSPTKKQKTDTTTVGRVIQCDADYVCSVCGIEQNYEQNVADNCCCEAIQANQDEKDFEAGIECKEVDGYEAYLLARSCALANFIEKRNSRRTVYVGSYKPSSDVAAPILPPMPATPDVVVADESFSQRLEVLEAICSTPS